MASKLPAVAPHGELIQLASNLWYVEGSIRMPFGTIHRNMVIYRLPGGQLLLHSVVALDEEGMRSLDALGQPTYMVVPHGGHRQDANFYKERYPGLKVIAPAAARAKVEEVIAVDATAEEALPALGVALHKVNGLKAKLGENALVVDVEGGKALIINDILGGGGSGFGRGLMMRLMGPPGGGLGIARAVRWVGVSDRHAVKATLHKLAEIPGLKILTISHGSPVRGQVADRIRAAAAQL